MGTNNRKINKLTIAAQTSKDSVSALDVGRALGLEIRHGRCQCPIHGGKDYNCVLYQGNRGYYCHVCKSGGDVISFVRSYYHDKQFKDIISWFDGTFNLGLDIDGYIDPAERKRAENALQRRKRAYELHEWKNRMQFELAITAEQIVRRLEDVRDEHRPRTYGTWDEEFYTAVRLLPDAIRFAEDCIMDCTGVKNNG